MFSQNFIYLMEKITNFNPEVAVCIAPTNRAEALKEFLANDCKVVPHFEYGHLNREGLQRIKDNLAYLEDYQKMSQDLLSAFELPIFSAMIKPIIQNNKLVLATYYANHNPKDTEHAKSFKAYNRLIYGHPDKSLFYALLKQRVDSLSKTYATAQEIRMYQALLKELSTVAYTDADNVSMFQPQPTTIARFKDLVLAEMSEMLDIIPQDQEEFSTDNVYSIATEIMAKLQTGFTVTKDIHHHGWEVMEQNRLLVIPDGNFARTYTRQELIEIFAHEIGVHIERGVAFQYSDLPILSYGVPGYEIIEEGIAKCVTQALSGKFAIKPDHYINIGLATFENFDFCKVYHVRFLMEILSTITPGETPAQYQEREAKAQNLAFAQTVRCFRGTGRLVNNKDLMYLNGQNLIWRYIESRIDHPDEIAQKFFHSGKTNFMNHFHMDLVSYL